MIVVCVEATAEVTIASSTTLSHGEPSTSSASTPRMPSSSSNSSRRESAGERDDCHRDRDVRHEQDHGARQGRQPRHEAAVRRLLTQVDGALPAPVGEDADQQRRDQRVAVVDREGREPRPRRVDRVGACVAAPDLAERDAGEEEQRPDLGDDHHVLHARRELRAEDADRREDDDVGDREQRHRGLRAGGAVRCRRAGTCSGRRRRRASRSRGFPSCTRPSRRSSRVGPERAGDPGERRPGVAVGPVHVEERAGDQEHRHEGREQRRRRLDTDDDDERADDRRERVGRRRRREPDHERVEEADRVRLQRRPARVPPAWGGFSTTVMRASPRRA